VRVKHRSFHKKKKPIENPTNAPVSFS